MFYFLLASAAAHVLQPLNFRALIPVATGTNAREFSGILQVFHNHGFFITVAAPAKGEVALTGGKFATATAALGEVENEHFDVVAIPGGTAGAAELAKSKALRKILTALQRAGKWIGAICVAPAVVLQPWGFLPPTVPATCFDAPEYRAKIAKNFKLVDPSDRVVVADTARIVTAVGPDDAENFAKILANKVN